MDILTLASDPQVLALDWSTGILGIVSGAMKLVAVLVFILAVVKSIKDVSGGKPGGAAKTIIGAAILVTFLWKPDLIESLIDAFAGLTGKGIEEIDTIVTTPGGAVDGGGAVK